MDFTLGSRSAKREWNDPATYARQPPPSVSAIRWGDKMSTTSSTPAPAKVPSSLDSILPTPTRRQTIVQFQDQSSRSNEPGKYQYTTTNTSSSIQETDAPPCSSMYDVDMSVLNTPTVNTPSAHVYPSATSAPSGWVTVFGFPSGSHQSVINHFRAVGQVVRIEQVAQGNWLNLEFSSDWAASRALTRNGTILPGTNCMIGVVPMQTTANAVASANSFLSPIKQPAVDQESFKKPAKPPQPPTTMAVSRPHHSSAQFKPSMDPLVNIYAANNTPQSQLSLVQRVFQFIFGW